MQKWSKISQNYFSNCISNKFNEIHWTASSLSSKFQALNWLIAWQSRCCINLPKLKLMHSKQRVRIRYFQSEAKQYKKQKLRNASNHRITYVAKTTKLQSTRQSWLAFPTLRQCDRLSFSSCLERKLTAKQLNDSYNKEKTTFKTRILSLCPLVDDFDIQTRSLSRKPVQFMLAPNKRSNFDQRHYHLGSGERRGPVRLSLSFWQTTIGTNILWGISMRPSPKCFRSVGYDFTL